ncbi:MAG: GNAT family N-acetyltransferase [Actinomycetes bacterium]
MIIGPIQTARLRLKPLQVSDANDMVAVLADESLYEFIGGQAPTIDVLSERYRSQTAGSNVPGELWLNWIIRPVIDQRAVGFIQATVGASSTDIAWLVGVPDQGRGFATEAARAVTEWLVGNGVGRIEAHIHPSHETSLSVARRIGLSPTATFDGDGEEIWAADFTR